MSHDSASAPVAQESEAPTEKSAQPRRESWLTLTPMGCRTEVRLGLLLSMAGVFVWLWQGPGIAVRLYFPGLVLLVVGLYLHLRDAWKIGRPGYPTKVGVILFLGGLALAYDVVYREEVHGSLAVHPIAPMVGAIGAVVLLGRLLLVWRPPREVPV